MSGYWAGAVSGIVGSIIGTAIVIGMIPQYSAKVISKCVSHPQWCEVEHPELYKAITAKGSAQ